MKKTFLFLAAMITALTVSAATEPEAAAPAPTKDAKYVKAVYSDAYTVDPTWGYLEGWGQSTAKADKTIGADHYLMYTNFNYLGWGCSSTINVASMEYLHIDIWAVTDGKIGIVPIYGGGGNATDDSHRKIVDLVGQQWNSFDLSLASDYAGLNLSSIFQFKFDNGTNCTDFAVDNVYFWRNPSSDTEAPTAVTATFVSSDFTSAVIAVSGTDNSGLVSYDIMLGENKVGNGAGASGATINITASNLPSGVENTLNVVAYDAENNRAAAVSVKATTKALPAAAPVPDKAAADVLSLYSDTYTFAPASLNSRNEGWWDQPSMSEITLDGGNKALYYYGRLTGMIGWQFAETDATGFDTFTMDIYPLADGTIDFGPLCTGDRDYSATGVAVVGNKWNTITIDLTGKTLNGLFQVKMINYSKLNGFFIDNVYLFKSGTPTPPPAEIDWSKIDWLGNGSGDAANTEAWKIVAPDGCSAINIQTNPWAAEAGIYVTVPSAEITACSLGEGKYAVQGTGVLLYLSAFTEQETEVTITNGGNNSKFVVYSKNAGGSSVTPVEGNLFNAATTTLSETWFGDGTWGQIYSSTATWDPATGKLTCVTGNPPYGLWHAQVKLLHTVDFAAGKFYQFSCKFTCSAAANGITIKLDNNTGMVYEEASVNVPAGEYTYTSPIKDGKAGNDHILVFDFGNVAEGTTVVVSDIVIVETAAPEVDYCEGTATASSNNSEAYLSADGNTGTRWHSNNEDGNEIFWQRNYTEAQTFNRVKIVWEGAWGKSFDILAGNDCDNLVKIAEVRNQSLSGFPYNQIIELDHDVTAKHVRFQGVEKATGYGYSFWELEVFEQQTPVLTTFEFSAASDLCKVGETVNMNPVAKDQYGVVMNDQTVTYEVSPSTAGHVTGNVYTADAFGEATITATCGTLFKSVNVFNYAGDNLALSATLPESKIIAQSAVDPNGSQYDAFFAIDPNDDSQWQGRPDGITGGSDEQRTYNSWFVVDLGSSYDINCVLIKFEGACSQEYTLDFSADNTNWVNAYTFVGNPGIWGHTDKIYAGSEKNLQNNKAVRYVRFFSTKAATEYGMKVYFFKVFGTPASAPTSIDSLSVDTKAVKVICNGQLFIIRDGIRYNAMGAQVE